MKHSMILRSLSFAALSICIGTVALAQAKPDPAAKPAPSAAQAKPVESVSTVDVVHVQKPSYPLKTCVISGEELKVGETVDYVAKDRLVRLCCNDCKTEFEKNPAAALKKIDDAVIAAQKPTYPLTTSPVSGNKLDDKAFDYVYGTRLVRLASKDEVAAFAKDPKSAMAKVDKALMDAQRPNYKLSTCIVSGKALDAKGEQVDALYGTTLVRFCCGNCAKKFQAEPDKFLADLNSAKK